jgi:hypothetical protein
VLEVEFPLKLLREVDQEFYAIDAEPFNEVSRFDPAVV